MKKARLLLICILLQCLTSQLQARIITGDERTDEYLPLLKGRRVALFSNKTGMAGQKHVLDLLLENGVKVACIFSPEHGFRGTADAGEHVASSKDEATGVDIVSLYDKNSPLKNAETMKRFDVLVVDIQDVGLRFYTYYVTMCNLMEACGRSGLEVMVLDRPNPNGHYVDGPILDMKYRSGVGRLPIPVVHGLTLGELALMANGEGWLEGGMKCKLTVIACKHYSHQKRVDIQIAPSPNLPNLKAVLLYPSLCYFEATPVSVGRGTNKPFQIYGHPSMKVLPFAFTPESRPGAKNPPQLGNTCYGRDLSCLSEKEIRKKGIDLSYLIESYRLCAMGDEFFTSFFEKLIGRGDIRQLIEEGKSADEIKATWQNDVKHFKLLRQRYLLYKE